ncbi:MAG: bifunctional glutamate N-acetyltransferase/amino-acid acetyltransferase ArgJ [Desulfatiglandales bacterium]|nr:bifunctional glutamate N-acetyltransferase/amino-acid acetyltransferase ArgJ [Desulfatiglandales bacterium]
MNSNEDIIQGFKASAVGAGLKKGGGRDLALIFSEKVTVAAGVFTTNRVEAAPVILSRENIQDGKVRAIIANSGNANACTGKDGLENARRTADLVAEELGIKPGEVLVASTGVIGVPLPMDLIGPAIPDLGKTLSQEGLLHVAEAIMTTDSFHKISRFKGVAGGKPYHILGIAKGAGMIMPDMATMLCFILSDVRIDADELREAVSSSVETTFNRISVDGDTSTNDMVLVMANGLTGNGALSSGDYERFQKGLVLVMDELATMIVRDGEGATKLISLKIKGAATDMDALAAARAIANSSLVKTAFYGQDPNWGRIMAVLGRSSIRLREEDISIWVDDVKIVVGGLGNGPDSATEAAKRMAEKGFSVTIDLHQGKYEGRILTCDLTHDYITINAEYRT